MKNDFMFPTENMVAMQQTVAFYKKNKICQVKRKITKMQKKNS